MDAGAAILLPRSLLRRRLLVMAGVLEASPEYASVFLSVPSGKLGQAASLVWWGARAAIKRVIGVPLVAAITSAGSAS